VGDGLREGAGKEDEAGDEAGGDAYKERDVEYVHCDAYLAETRELMRLVEY
jgi:hypothetical protein